MKNCFLELYAKFFSGIGADISDSTNANVFSFGILKEDPTWFELDRIQRRHFEEIQAVNSYLREEYHSIQEIMWKTGRSRFYGDIPERYVSLHVHVRMLCFYSPLVQQVTGSLF